MSQLTLARTASLSLTLLLLLAIALSWFARVGSAACTVPSFQAINIALGNPSALIVDDFNKDGNQHLAIAEDVGVDTVAILLGNGSGGFSGPRRFWV